MLRGLELQCHPVVAEAFAGRRRTVVEHVALVASAARAVVFGARQDQVEVALEFDGARQRLKKARPAGSAVELGLAFEQRLPAAGATKGSRALLVVECAAEGRLGSFLAQHPVLLRTQAP